MPDQLSDQFDFLIIGTGLAGLNAALLAREHGSVCLLSKGETSETNTNRAQGGIAAAIAAGDDPQRHAEDTIRAGAGLCDERAVRTLVEQGPAAVRRLIALGVEFDRAADGELALAREGAHSQPRVLHAGGDRTGLHIQRALERCVAQAVECNEIDLRERWTAVELAIEAGRCVGALAADPGGRLRTIAARATLLATGGIGALYASTTNPPTATADGLGLALRAGAVLRDLEFVQFHPTALAAGGGPAFLVSEALRGEGALLLDNAGRRFAADAHPDAELAPRSVVAQAISEAMRRDDAAHVWLDISHRPADFLRERFPGVYAGCLERGHDLTAGPIPVAPAAHYHMGGVWTDLDGRTTIGGLYAAGETATVGAHGANRVASNSLLEAAVFSARAIRAAAEAIDAPPGDPPAPPERAEALPINAAAVAPSWAELRRTLSAGAGIVRDAAGLSEALAQMRGWPQANGGDPSLASASAAAQAIAHAALVRAETRGGHLRADRPDTDPAWRRRLAWRIERE